MATVTKFEFSTVFDSEDADPGVVAVEEQQPAAPTFSNAELEAAGARGFADGREAGRAEALASIDQASAQALAMAADQLRLIAGTQTDALEVYERQALELAAAIVRKIVPEVARETALSKVEWLVRDTLGRLMDEPRVVVRINDDMLDRLQDRIQTLADECGYPGQIIMLAESAMSPSDCRIEWADGGAELDSGRIWREIDQALERMLDSTADSATVAGETPEAVPVSPAAINQSLTTNPSQETQDA